MRIVLLISNKRISLIVSRNEIKLLTSLGERIDINSSYMRRVFSAITSGFVSRFKSSQAVQKRMFSSEYSQRRKSLKCFLPTGNNGKQYVKNA